MTARFWPTIDSARLSLAKLYTATAYKAVAIYLTVIPPQILKEGERCS